MKSVLISIQPKWCELIANGKKTVEVRKTRPKIETPFKCYIYCTKSNKEFLQSRNNVLFYCEDRDFIGGHGVGLYKRLNGKVIGEFVCDAVISRCEMANADIAEQQGCIKREDLLEYAGNKELYGWHISNLIIYDKPKDLSEFVVVDDKAIKECKHRERVFVNPDCVNGAWLRGGYICTKGEEDWCSKCKTKPITRPPQSWCYVEKGGGCDA